MESRSWKGMLAREHACTTLEPVLQDHACMETTGLSHMCGMQVGMHGMHAA